MAYLSLMIVRHVGVGLEPSLRAETGCPGVLVVECGRSQNLFISLSNVCDGDYKQHYGQRVFGPFLNSEPSRILGHDARIEVRELNSVKLTEHEFISSCYSHI